MILIKEKKSYRVGMAWHVRGCRMGHLGGRIASEEKVEGGRAYLWPPLRCLPRPAFSFDENETNEKGFVL